MGLEVRHGEVRNSKHMKDLMFHCWLQDGRGQIARNAGRFCDLLRVGKETDFTQSYNTKEFDTINNRKEPGSKFFHRAVR